MSKCNTRLVAQTLGQKKLDELMQVYFTVMQDIDACAKINTKKYENTLYGGGAYSQTSVPEDMIQICESFGCKNTGTLYLIPSMEGDGDERVGKFGAVFRKITDATAFYAGVMYYYVNLPTNGEYKITTSIGDINTVKRSIRSKRFGNDYDSYEQTINVEQPGFYPISVDFAKVATSVQDEGWVATTSGVIVQIEIESKAVNEDDVVGVSSISFFEDIEDMEGNDTVALGCLTGVDATDSIDTLEDACDRAGYDESSASITRSVTARKWSANVDKLNPFINKTERTQGFYTQTKKFVVEKDEETGYGVVHISTLNVEQCGFTSVTLEDNCNITDGLFVRVNNPNLMTLNERQYQLITVKLDPNVSFIGGKYYFDSSLIGKEVRISYPEEAEAVIYDATNTYLNEKRYKMSYSVMRTDGTMAVETYYNVFPTSFPKSISNSDAEFTFEISVKRDNDGRWYEEQIINKAEYTL